ncbi:hypothetical protein [Chryseobacterium sp. ERMR1:04]|nr:hypothetical protein [Chryseobacterium sp. ERMR1:04]
MAILIESLPQNQLYCQKLPLIFQKTPVEELRPKKIKIIEISFL